MAQIFSTCQGFFLDESFFLFYHLIMRYIYAILFTILLLAHHPALAVSVIRDTEIEDVVTGWVKSIFKAAHLSPDSAEIVLINDPSINAFVAGGQTIFVHTGLFTNANSIDEIMFVLSHETGHIVGGHITRGIAAMERAQAATLVSTILGGVLAVVSGRPDAGIAVMIGSQGSAMGQFLAYRQTEESSADRTAVDVMTKLGYSMQGFTDIMKSLRRLELINDESEKSYLRTHPMTQNRIRDLDRFTKNAPEVQNNIDFENIKAKLIAFMEKPQDVLLYYKGSSFADRYARAIAYYRQHKLDQSFQTLDELIKEYPKNPYLYELKGQFSFEKGMVDQAIQNYEKANQLKPGKPLIELALAQSYLEKKDKTSAQKALPFLQQATLQEPDLALAWRLMASAYNYLGKTPESEYAMVEYERASDKIDAAQKRAKKLLGQLNPSTPYYQRLQDILDLAKEDHE